MNIQRAHRQAFTLVEILVVVVILGILAAIVIPQFTNAAETAKSAQMLAQLHTIRTQMELYRLRHNDYPTVAQLWGNLTNKTHEDGTIDPAGEFGPYLEREPINEWTKSYTVVEIGAGTIHDGWEYGGNPENIRPVGFNENTGVFTPPGD